MMSILALNVEILGNLFLGGVLWNDESGIPSESISSPQKVLSQAQTKTSDPSTAGAGLLGRDHGYNATQQTTRQNNPCKGDTQNLTKVRDK